MKITNPSQFEKLVAELEKRPSFANGFRKGSVPSCYKEQWEDIAAELNALGPPKRSGEGWQKVWRDYKFKIRKKMHAMKSGTGDLKYQKIIFSPLEKSVINLLNFKEQAKEKSPNTEVQYQEQSVDYELVKTEEFSDIEDLNWTDVQNSSESESREVPSKSSSPHAANCVPLKRKRTPDSTNAKRKIFKRNKTPKMKKNTNQHQLTINSLSLIKRALQDINQYREELLEIEKTKLKLAFEKDKREKEIHEVMLKIKKMELTIKEKELEIYNRFL